MNCKMYNALFGMLLMFSIESSASLVSNDFASAGDGLLTYDTDSGLAWLDLTETIGQSFNAISGGFGGFTANHGFRYANTDEVATLFSNAGVALVTGSAGWGYWNFSNPGYLANTTLVSMLGITYPFDGLTTGSMGIINSNTTNQISYHDYAGVFYNNHADYGALLVAGQLSDSESSPYVGSFLVRNINFVPLPSAMLLFGTALIGLLGVCRKGD